MSLLLFFVLANLEISSAAPEQERYELLSNLHGEFSYCLDLKGIDSYYNNPFLAIDIQSLECDKGVLSPFVLPMLNHWLMEECDGIRQISAAKTEKHCYSQMFFILDSVHEDSGGKYTRLRFLVPKDLKYLIIKYRLRTPDKRYFSSKRRIILGDDYYLELVSKNSLDEELNLLDP